MASAKKFELCASSYFGPLLTTRLSISILVWVVIQCHTHSHKIGRDLRSYGILNTGDLCLCKWTREIKANAHWMRMHLIQLQWISGDILNARKKLHRFSLALQRAQNLTHIFGASEIVDIYRRYESSTQLIRERLSRKNIFIGDIYFRPKYFPHRNHVDSIPRCNGWVFSLMCVCVCAGLPMLWEWFFSLEYVYRSMFTTWMRSSPQISFSSSVSCHRSTNICTFQPNTTNKINTKSK